MEDVVRACKWCGKEYPNKRRLKSHRLKRHPDLLVEDTKKKVKRVLDGINKQVQKKQSRRKSGEGSGGALDAGQTASANDNSCGSTEDLLRATGTMTAISKDLKRKDVPTTSKESAKQKQSMEKLLPDSNKNPQLNNRIEPKRMKLVLTRSVDSAAMSDSQLNQTSTSRLHVSTTSSTLLESIKTANGDLDKVTSISSAKGRKKLRCSYMQCTFVAKTPDGLKKHVKLQHSNASREESTHRSGTGKEQKQISHDPDKEKALEGVTSFEDSSAVPSPSEVEVTPCSDTDEAPEAESGNANQLSNMSKKCPVCNQSLPFDTTIDKTRYREHVDIHSGLRPFVCPYFKECGRSFTDPVDLLSHSSTAHDIQDCFECDRCGKSFNLKTHFVKHKRHSKECRPSQAPLVPLKDSDPPPGSSKAKVPPQTEEPSTSAPTTSVQKKSPRLAQRKGSRNAKNGTKPKPPKTQPNQIYMRKLRDRKSLKTCTPKPQQEISSCSEEDKDSDTSFEESSDSDISGWP